MLRKLVSLFGIFLIIPMLSRAQVVTQNAYVEADVSGDSLGLVRIYYANAEHSEYISNPAYRSYLTVQVNGNYYTNNPNLDTLAPDTLVPFAFKLKNGATKKIADTIETVWRVDTADVFEVIQDIYPVAFPFAGAGQIVYKFSIRNLEKESLPVQVEYLMDIELGAPGDRNDNPAITTRYGYTTNWSAFSSQSYLPIPSYYIATLSGLSSDNFPALVAMGYNNDSLAPSPMRLMQPQTFTYVNWQTIVHDWTWGFPTTPGLKDSDAALLTQWPSSMVNAGTTVELGRGSYGSASCAPICIGGLNLMTVHPSHIAWDPAHNTFVPNHFPVDAIFWDPGEGTNTALGTQSITNSVTGFSNGPVRIVSPLPTTNNGYTQQHSMTGANLSSSSITWEDTVVPGALLNCSTDSSYDITFNVISKGLINYSGSCSCPIFIDCPEKDETPPRHSPHVMVGDTNHCGYTIAYTDSVFDNNATDQGLQSIAWFVTPNANDIEVDTGNHSECSTSEVPITVTQIDSTASCVYFAFTDCAGNVSYDSVCFAGCASEFMDTLPPKFSLLQRYDLNTAGDTSCGYKCSEWSVTDSVIKGLQHDGGLASVTVVYFTNMTFALKQPVTPGIKEDSFTTCVVDSTKEGSVVISVADEAGNITFKTISYCPASAAVSEVPVQPISLSIYPSPMESEVTILLSGAPSADVEIFDVLGREVDRFRVAGSYEWETAGLPSGTYIIRANENGQGNSQPITKRIVKE